MNITRITPYKNETSENWNTDITELENYFTGIGLPTQPIKLNKYTTINNVSQFIDSHLCIAKANNGNPTFKPYIIRLKEFKDIIYN